MKYYPALLLSFLLLSCSYRVGNPLLSLKSEYTGAIQTDRIEHRATVLADGRVFLSGGALDGFSHEIYIPDTRTWESVPSSPISFQSHGMITLPDGRVLLVGGYQRDDTLGARQKIGDKVLLFDPENKEWTAAASLNQGRASLSLSLLPDGKVLAVGGFYLEKMGSREFSRMSSVAEIYDPVADTWTFAPSMIIARARHERILLPDGRILILGGDVNEFNGEIYDPSLNTWSAIAQPSLGFRRGFRAVLLDNDQVMLAGGVLEGVEGNQIATVYSLSENKWKLVAPMKEPRFDHTLLSIGDGKVLAIGGKGRLDDHPFYPTVEQINTCEMYDKSLDSWRAIGKLQVARSGHVSIPLTDNNFLTVGGSGDANKGAEVQTVE